MKKLLALMLCAALFLCLAPSVFASSLLPKPGEGQVIFLEADNDLEYRADFPLSAVTAAKWLGDDLYLQFPAAKMTLKGFFAPYGEWRRLHFSDGMSLGGADFDENGLFSGVFSHVTELGKAPDKESAPTVNPIKVDLTQSGLNIVQDGQGLYGELRQRCVDITNMLTMNTSPDWQLMQSRCFEFYFGEDGDIVPAKTSVSYHDGIDVQCVNPQVVFISGSLSLVPIAEGRAILSYENRLGDELIRLNVRCAYDEAGQLKLHAPCESCGGNQEGQLHMLICGHYSCQAGFDMAGHEKAQCGIAGHCASEGEHGRCKNCLEPMCTGDGHGYGLCLHEHNWMPISAHSSQCVSCGYTYNSAGAATS